MWVWVSLEPSPKEVAELVQQFPTLVKLLEEEVRMESERWAAEVVVARSLGRRVSTEVVVRKFWQRERLKGEVVSFNLEQGHLMFRF